MGTVKTDDYNRKNAVKKLIQISKNCDRNNDGKLTCSESVQAAKQFEKIAYTIGIRIE